jgi:hypothetical protein
MKIKAVLHLLFPLLVVGGTVLACVMAPQPSSDDVAGIVLDAEGNPVLPADLEGYQSAPGAVSEAEEEILPADTRFAKMRYLESDNPFGEELIFSSIVLSGTERRSLHRPEICLPGQGWHIKSTKVIPVSVEGYPDFEVRDLYLERQEEDETGGVKRVRAHYVYWWVGKDLSTAYTWKRVVLTSMDNIFRNVNHRWAYPSVMTVVHKRPSETNLEADTRAVDRIRAFIGAAVPKFQKSLAAN